MGAYDLTTVERAKEYVGASGHDTMIGRMITAATHAMERYTGRQLVSRAHTDWVNGSGSSRLYLPHWPITALSRLCIGTRSTARIYNTSADAAYAIVSASSTGLTLTVVGGANAGTITSITWAKYTTIATVVAAVNAAGSGWFAEVLNDCGAFPSSDTRIIPGNAALNNGGTGASFVELEAPDEPLGGIYIDPDGRYILCNSGFPRGTQNIFASYTAGYTEASDGRAALEQICLEIVARMYSKREKGGLRSESLDGYSYTLAAESELQADIKAMLAPYVRVLL